MKNILILIILIFAATLVKAQTLYTRTDSIAIYGDSVTLHSGPFRGTIQWQHSLNGQFWNNIEGKTSQLIKVAKSSEGYYRALITDNTCTPTYSDTAVVVAYKTGNPMVIDPDEVEGTIFLDRDDRTFTFISKSDTTISVNTVFLENDKESDIRVVSDVTKNGDTLSVNTLPGKMEDLFVNREFKLSTEIIPPSFLGSNLSNTEISSSLTDKDGFIHPVEVVNLNAGNPNLKSAGIIGEFPDVNISKDLTYEKLYNKNGMELTIMDGYFNMRADLKSEFNFKPTKFQWKELPSGKLKSCSFYTDGEKTVTETKLILKAEAYGPVSIDETFVLNQEVYKNLFKFWVGEVPVWMYVKIDLMAKVKGYFSNTFLLTGGAKSNHNINLGSNYSNGEWSSFFNYSKEYSLYSPVFDGHIRYSLLCEVYPRIETFFYFSFCPYHEIIPSIREKMDYSMSDNYDSELSVGLDARTGVAGNILGYGISEFENEFNYEPDTLFQEPQKLVIISGNEQEGIPGEMLELPIVISVVNSNNNPIPYVPVYFNTSSGFIDLLSPRTDSNGKVSIKWTLGNSPGVQILEAFLKDGNDNKVDKTIKNITCESILRIPKVVTSSIKGISDNSAESGGNVTSDGGTRVISRGICWNTNGNPTIANNRTINGSGKGTFTSFMYGLSNGYTYYVRAYATNSEGTAYGNQLTFKPGTLNDSRDGKSYQTVVIGDQNWMAENLAYMPTVTPDNYWSINSACYYAYDKATYGVLYNWQAAASACPAGWHLPSDTEWNILANYLGGFEVAGGKMKSETGWVSPNIGATNESGFNGLPGGGFNHGSYFNTGVRGYWWTSTEIDPELVWDRSLYNVLTELYRAFYFREVGFSVRCVED